MDFLFLLKIYKELYILFFLNFLRRNWFIFHFFILFFVGLLIDDNFIFHEFIFDICAYEFILVYYNVLRVVLIIVLFEIFKGFMLEMVLIFLFFLLDKL
jgi:hypothetical protein